MSENRFSYNVNKNTIEENGKHVAYMNCVDGVRIANKLNILQKENEHLKKSLKRQQSSNNECAKLIKEQQKGNEQLKNENNILKASNGEYEDALARLEEENEQLKERLKMNCPEFVWRDLE